MKYFPLFTYKKYCNWNWLLFIFLFADLYSSQYYKLHSPPASHLPGTLKRGGKPQVFPNPRSTSTVSRSLYKLNIGHIPDCSQWPSLSDVTEDNDSVNPKNRLTNPQSGNRNKPPPLPRKLPPIPSAAPSYNSWHVQLWRKLERAGAFSKFFHLLDFLKSIYPQDTSDNNSPLRFDYICELTWHLEKDSGVAFDSLENGSCLSTRLAATPGKIIQLFNPYLGWGE